MRTTLQNTTPAKRVRDGRGGDGALARGLGRQVLQRRRAGARGGRAPLLRDEGHLVVVLHVSCFRASRRSLEFGMHEQTDLVEF